MNKKIVAKQICRAGAGLAKICRHSFFNGAMLHREAVRRRRRLTAVTVCLTLCVIGIMANFSVSFAVYFNGEGVGVARNIVDVRDIVAETEKKLSDIFGYDYSIEDGVSVETNIGSRLASAHEIETNIIKSIDGVFELYTISVNGALVGGSKNAGDIQRILDEILNMYKTDATSSIRFTDDIRVEHRFVSESTVTDLNRLKAVLYPGNEGSRHRLSVEMTESVLRSESVPFETKYEDAPDTYSDETRLLKAGEPGIRQYTEMRTYFNGAAVSQEVENVIIIKAPSEEIVGVGTKERPLTASYGSYIWPAEGLITSEFGYRRTSVGSTNHEGLDIAGRSGQTIIAADGGEVVYSGWKKAYGYMVQIKHDNGDETVYGHCSALIAKEGDRVYRGQEIARMGSTGLSSGVHLHFEVRVDETPVDPMNYLP